MGMIRGKVEGLREIVPKYITVGEPRIRQLDCGCCWVDVKTGEKVEVEITTLAELMDEYKEKCFKESK